MLHEIDALIGNLLAHTQRAADFGQTSFEVNVKAAVQHRVDGAVEQRQSLGERVDRVGDGVLVLGPDVDQVNDEVRRPAAYERAYDAQRHLQTDRQRLLLLRRCPTWIHSSQLETTRNRGILRFLLYI